MKARWTCAAIAALAALGCSGGTEPKALITCDVGSPGVSLSLSTGAVQVLSGAEAVGCMQFAGTGSAAEYIVIPANADSIPDVVGRLKVAATTTLAAAPDVSWSVSPSPFTMSPLAGSLGLGDIGRTRIGIETRLRAAERATLAPIAGLRFGPRASTSRSAAISSTTSLALGPCSAFDYTTTASEGSLCTLKVPKADATNLCTNYVTVVAQIKKVGNLGIIAEDTTTPQAGNFTAADYTSIANEFDNGIYAADVAYFGAPSDNDGNSKVFILYTPEVNKLTARGSEGKFGGFFFGGDLFPKTACPESNEGEIFYLLAPDSLARYSDARKASEVKQETRGTIAHEFQHMINQGVRMENPDPTAEIIEATWLNEALSHLAEELVGRRIKGYGDTGNLTFATVGDQANGYRDFNAFFYQNFARFRFWQVMPDTSAATSSRADKELAYRGAAWALLRYTIDQYDGGDVPSMTRALVVGPEVSTANLVKRAGVPFDTLVAGWLVASYTDDAGIAGLGAKYSFTSWNVRDVATNINRLVYSSNTYPLLVRPMSETGITLNARSATGAYFRLGGGGNPVPATGVSVTTPAGTAVTFRGARVYVVRTQ